MQIHQAYLMHKMDSSAPVIGYTSMGITFAGTWSIPAAILQTEKISTALPGVFLDESLISLLQLKNSQGTFISESILTFTATTISG